MVLALPQNPPTWGTLSYTEDCTDAQNQNLKYVWLAFAFRSAAVRNSAKHLRAGPLQAPDFRHLFAPTYKNQISRSHNILGFVVDST
jgi:hypothetical protein